MPVRARNFIDQHPVIAFFVLSYVLSWLVWGLGAAFWPGGADELLPSWLGGFGPALAAILVAAITAGKDGLENLLSRLFVWRVKLTWYLVALFLPLLMVLAAAGLTALFGVPTPTESPDPARVIDVLPELVLVSLAAMPVGAIVTAGRKSAGGAMRCRNSRRSTTR